MKLSRTVSYALQATLQLARANRGVPVPCSQLAAEGGMPERFLLQILRNLVTHGILESTRGVEGGYTLSRNPEEVSLLEVIEAIDGPMGASIATNEGLSRQSQRVLQDALEGVAAITRKELESIKLAHLLRPPRA